MSIFHQYKIFCETDQKFEYVWRASDEGEPTSCPIDTNHTCNLDSIAINQTVDNSVRPVEVLSQAEHEPFAKPTYRTKWDASSDVVTMGANEVTDMDLVLSEERYAHGGSVVYEGIKLGDWLEAEIRDEAGFIPEEYRSTLCEDWPLVAKYISRYYLPPGSGQCDMSTYPLNAKIPPGLMFRVTIHTCSEVGERKLATNYYLTKKL